MNRRLFTAAMGVVLSLAGSQQAARADLESDVQAVLRDKSLAKVEAGVAIAKLSSGQAAVVFRYKADVPRTPASNLKVVTTSAALDKFGANFKYRTCLVQRGNDVIIWGDGDPTLGDAELLRGSGWTITTVFKNWADQLKKRGITSVNNVVVDDSVFDQVFYHPNWPENQYNAAYCAQVAGLNLNANLVNVTVKPAGGKGTYAVDPATSYFDVKSTLAAGKGNRVALSRHNNSNQLTLAGTTSGTGTYAVTVHDPSLYAAQAFAEVLAESGIRITGGVKRDRTTRAAYVQNKGGFSVLAIHETPITAALDRANKDSMNLYAEALCKRLGYATTGQPGSWTNGPAAVGAFLTGKVGIPATEFHLDDGCGLSKENRISANGMLRILMYDFNSPNRDTFLSSLAVAGEDGTLEKRFRGSDLDGRVYAKTGFVNGVSSLSGYVKTKSNQWYAFSILFNNIPMYSNSTYKPLQERIVAAIDRNAK
jgi:D-alanyl-D-alanine carboxypeptidase/D-alanyl-D-alanine-endopeptidase (penicillin-binding protein 4)